MNWDTIEGNWKQFEGKAREKWGKLTGNDWETIGGKKDQLVGHVQKHYGYAKDDASKHVDDWMTSLDETEAKTRTA